MSQDSAAIRRPRTDDRPLWDVFLALRGYPAVLIAQERKLFQNLGESPKTLDEVCRELKIRRRPAEALLSVCTSLGFVAFENGRYSLTPIAEDYLLPSSPTYYGWWFEAFAETFSLESLRKAVATDQPQGPYEVRPDADVYDKWPVEQREEFTRAMHSASMASALAWPPHIDLSSSRTMLDIGGGSGAHSIGAVTTWPKLIAVILDIPAVCEGAKGFIAQYGLQQRISTQAANFFVDPFPEADIHFYGMIFHNWPEEKCRSLARKSFKALSPGGRIIIHEMLFNDNRTGPFPAAAFNVDMLVAMPGEQYSGSQIVKMLIDAGFTSVEIKSTFGYWSIVTGRKR